MVLVHKCYLDYVLIKKNLVGDEESNIEGVWLPSLLLCEFGQGTLHLCVSGFFSVIGNNNLQGCCEN